MSRPAKLTPDARTHALAHMPGWVLADDQTSISQEFNFTTFAKAWTFMCRIASAAEKLDHHPDWSNSYTRVSIALTTHDQGGLTHLDMDLAQAIDQFFADAAP